jgi:hypothetical protein
MVAALHTEKRSTFTDLEANDICAKYLSLAIQEHHKDLTELSIQNVDCACLASSMLRIHSFARLQARPLEPHTPPLNWLRMSNSIRDLFLRALDLVQDNPESVAYVMIDSVSEFLNDNQSEEMRRDWKHLLSREEPHKLEEPWDSETEVAYAGALSVLGGTWKTMGSKKHSARSVCRKLIVFPMLLHKRFADIVEELRPRALVILAHYFALLSTVSKHWWIGDSGFREVRAICLIVPEEWQSLLDWPKRILLEQDVTMDEI